MQLAGVQLPILAQVAARDPEDDGRSVRFTGLLPVSAAAVLHWESAVEYAGAVLNNPEAAAARCSGNDSPDPRRGGATAFPNTTWDEDAAAREHTSQHPARCASRWPTSIPMPARTSPCSTSLAPPPSPPALQYAFRRHLDTTHSAMCAA